MSNIEWTEQTWNPVVGCSRISKGCQNCYAEGMAARLNLMGTKQYEGLTTGRGKKARWTGLINHVPKSLSTPTTIKRPTTFFVGSMTDIFHPDVGFNYTKKIFDVMDKCPQHVFQILTKRVEKMAEFFEEYPDIYKPNMHLGVSIENQGTAWRAHYLKFIKADEKWLSIEPLLGPLDIILGGIEWGVVGGETGSGARPMHIDWVRRLREECSDEGVPFFFKQWGAYGADGGKRSKKANGRLLDGLLHDGRPQCTKQ